ncbi:MAG TPA: M14 family zinc carboxypeptidase [Melioribacteraceae bacterium]|nr:M14 family zinc carboxypeptidase [Melioribacteraceae bacterium]
MNGLDITAKDLFEINEKYYETTLKNKRFEHKNIVPLLEKLDGKFTISELGKSINGKSINLVKIGTGNQKILLWSQMHGDEPTATMAFFDFFNFLSSVQHSKIAKKILNNTTLYFIPMLNPDGAEKIDRRNAVGIDLNRDYLREQTPEAKILKKLALELQPDFAFNMHDQDFRWSVGDSKNLATLSFLASVIDNKKTVNENRAKAIKLINLLYKDAETVIPGSIARYLDDYEPRSFGDNFSNYFPTILIESGRFKNDINKTFTRKLTFALMVKAFLYIADSTYINEPIEPYYNIPTNGVFLYDLILRNVNYKINDINLIIDICINREESYFDNERIPYFISSVEEIGDGRNFKGIEEMDCSGLLLETDDLVETPKLGIEIDDNYISGILAKGKLFIKLEHNKPYFNKSINILTNDNNNKLDLHKPANFVLKQNGLIKFIVVNGMLADINNLTELKINGLVF